MSHHLLVAGTGRAGTSFLVQLLHELGLETHLSQPEGFRDWFEDANAGLEDMLSGSRKAPYVVKSPWLFEWIDDLLANRDHVIDGVIIPIRDLADAASSRIVLEFQHLQRTVPWLADQSTTWTTWGYSPGGAVYSLDPKDQEKILAVGFYRVLQRLTAAKVPFQVVAFPDFITDGGYLHNALRAFLPADVSEVRFLDAHARLADDQKVRVAEHRTPSVAEAENAALRRELKSLRIDLGKFAATLKERDALALQVAEMQAEIESFRNSSGLLHRLRRL